MAAKDDTAPRPDQPPLPQFVIEALAELLLDAARNRLERQRQQAEQPTGDDHDCP